LGVVPLDFGSYAHDLFHETLMPKYIEFLEGVFRKEPQTYQNSDHVLIGFFHSGKCSCSPSSVTIKIGHPRDDAMWREQYDRRL
jgi:hypothetical protein